MKKLVLETTSPFQGLPELVAYNEDLVDAARERRRESVGRRGHEVRVARDDRPLGRKGENAVELLAVAVDVEVHDRAARDLDGMRDPA